jgi:hypothetical protein
VFVASGADATGIEHHGPRAGTHLDFKVLTKDTQAGFFLVEHRNVPQGGPVRHLHYAQEEWFYLIEGTRVVIEVGDERAIPYLRHEMCPMYGPTSVRSQDGC